MSAAASVNKIHSHLGSSAFGALAPPFGGNKGMITDVSLPSHYSPSSGSGASGSSSWHLGHLDQGQEKRDEERDFKIISMFSSVDEAIIEHEAINEHAEQEEVSLPSDVDNDDDTSPTLQSDG